MQELEWVYVDLMCLLIFRQVYTCVGSYKEIVKEMHRRSITETQTGRGLHNKPSRGSWSGRSEEGQLRKCLSEDHDVLDGPWSLSRMDQ